MSYIESTFIIYYGSHYFEVVYKCYSCKSEQIGRLFVCKLTARAYAFPACSGCGFFIFWLEASSTAWLAVLDCCSQETSYPTVNSTGYSCLPQIAQTYLPSRGKSLEVEDQHAILVIFSSFSETSQLLELTTNSQVQCTDWNWVTYAFNRKQQKLLMWYFFYYF